MEFSNGSNLVVTQIKLRSPIEFSNVSNPSRMAQSR